MSDAMEQALRLQRRAVAIGFDWRDIDEMWDKLLEEVDELREAVAGDDPECVREELGDVLFMVVNLARQLGVDPDVALSGTNAKFQGRFARIEAELDRLPPPGDPGRLDAMEAVWQSAKADEKRHKRRR
ncbi:MAG: MazG nucleotide pyrophosphohydrolase domain-containing protein [Nevskiales bacterium]|nr:MazG nucleotide pyrophosphohydrolase domain-containing protein [Nevskiales bacterium]